MKIRTGDTVKILSGKDKGKMGQVIAVDVENRKVTVEGLNVATKHVKAQGREKPGGRIKISVPMHVSKVMFVDPASGKPSRLAIKREAGKKTRISKRTGKAISLVSDTEEKKVKSKSKNKKK